MISLPPGALITPTAAQAKQIILSAQNTIKPNASMLNNAVSASVINSVKANVINKIESSNVALHPAKPIINPEERQRENEKDKKTESKFKKMFANITEYVKDKFSDITSMLKSEFDTVLGPHLIALFNTLKKISTSILKFFGPMIKNIGTVFKRFFSKKTAIGAGISAVGGGDSTIGNVATVAAGSAIGAAAPVLAKTFARILPGLGVALFAGYLANAGIKNQITSEEKRKKELENFGVTKNDAANALTTYKGKYDVNALITEVDFIRAQNKRWLMETPEFSKDAFNKIAEEWKKTLPWYQTGTYEEWLAQQIDKTGAKAPAEFLKSGMSVAEYKKFLQIMTLTPDKKKILEQDTDATNLLTTTIKEQFPKLGSVFSNIIDTLKNWMFPGGGGNVKDTANRAIDVAKSAGSRILGMFTGKNAVENDAYKFLQAQGLPKETIAAIMGNLNVESKFDPNAWNDTFITKKDGTKERENAYGLAQWRKERLTGLINYARNKGEDITVSPEGRPSNISVQSQLEYLMLEAQRRKMFEMMQGKSLEEQSNLWLNKFEVASKASAGTRIDKSREYLNFTPLTDFSVSTRAAMGLSEIISNAGKNFGDNCGDAVAKATNTVLSTQGYTGRMLPYGGLNTNLTDISKQFGTPLLGRGTPITLESLKAMGPGTVIAYTRPDGTTHAEQMLNDGTIASFNAGKGYSSKTLNQAYVDKVAGWDATATNPLLALGQTTSPVTTLAASEAMLNNATAAARQKQQNTMQQVVDSMQTVPTQLASAVKESSTGMQNFFSSQNNTTSAEDQFNNNDLFMTLLQLGLSTMNL